MSSIDEESGFPDNPLTRAGVVFFVVGGVILVGILLLLGVNQLFPLRSQLLSLRFLLPGWLLQVASRFESVSPGSWHRHHTLAVVLITLFYAVGPIALARSLREITVKNSARRSIGSAWLTALALACGSGLTFFALLGPLMAVPAALVNAYTVQRNFENRLDRTVLSADMEMMALKAQVIYHQSRDHRAAWAGDREKPSLLLEQIAIGEPVLLPLLTGGRKTDRSYFVLSVTHPDTLLIYGRRGGGEIEFNRTAVLQACDNGEAPPGITVTPNSWRWNFG